MGKRRAQVTILLLRRSPAIMDMVWITPLLNIKVNNYSKHCLSPADNLQILMKTMMAVQKGKLSTILVDLQRNQNQRKRVPVAKCPSLGERVLLDNSSSNKTQDCSAQGGG